MKCFISQFPRKKNEKNEKEMNQKNTENIQKNNLLSGVIMLKRVSKKRATKCNL